MPKHKKHSQGRLTIHLEELVQRANAVMADEFIPGELELESLIEDILRDYNAHAGIDRATGQFRIHDRLVAPLD